MQAKPQQRVPGAELRPARRHRHHGPTVFLQQVGGPRESGVCVCLSCHERDANRRERKRQATRTTRYCCACSGLKSQRFLFSPEKNENRQTEPIRAISNVLLLLDPLAVKQQRAAAPPTPITGTQSTEPCELPDSAASDKRKPKTTDRKLMFPHYPPLKHYAVVQLQEQQGANAECPCMCLLFPPSAVV